jgi:phospholipid/cholesterol/gamma-HCH transport system substrate-binding protein
VRGQESVRSSAVKVALFGLLSVAIVLTIAATIRPLGTPGTARTYTAEFTSASRLREGADVMVGGIRVGRVTAVELTTDNLASVTFQVEDDVRLTRSSRVAIRYLDLVGNRYVALFDPGRNDEPQPVGETIGVDRTAPALDLNVLLNGFKPLFAALDPEDVNALATDIIRTFQGEGVTVRQLIARTASLTSGLAERDELIGSVIGNLGATVRLVAGRQSQMEQLVSDLARFATGLARDREAIGDTLTHIDTMASLSAQLLRDSRPALRADITHLRQIATVLARPESRREIAHALDHLPVKLSRMSRTASYGSWFNYYVCSVKLRVDGTAFLEPVVRRLLDNITLNDSAKRCQS